MCDGSVAIFESHDTTVMRLFCNAVFGEAKSITFSTYLQGKHLDSASVLAPDPTS